MPEQQTVARPPEQDSQTPWNRLKQATVRDFAASSSARPACRGRRRGVSDLEIVLCKARRPRERRYSERPDRGRRFRRGAVDDRAHSRNAFPRRRQRQCRRIHRDSRLRTTSRSRESGRAALRQAEAKAQSAWDQIAVLHSNCERTNYKWNRRKSTRKGEFCRRVKRWRRPGRPRRPGSRLSARALRQRRLRPAG